MLVEMKWEACTVIRLCGFVSDGSIATGANRGLQRCSAVMLLWHHLLSGHTFSCT